MSDLWKSGSWKIGSRAGQAREIAGGCTGLTRSSLTALKSIRRSTRFRRVADTRDGRTATLAGAAVRSRSEEAHQVSLPWQLTEHDRVDGFQVPDTGLPPLRVPPNLTSSAPFTCSDAPTIPFDASTTALWQL